MDGNSQFYAQVQLLVRVLPFVAKVQCFALKGGTAINLFVRDLPRLSVDIDLTYLPIESRDDSLRHVHEALGRIAADLRQSLLGCSVVESYQDAEDSLRLTVRQSNATIKIELSPVLRGSVTDPVLRTVSETVEREFGFAEMQVLDLPDLYGGKICAALDRQHPRDLFDVKLLLENEGLTDDIRKAFIVYLISHPRTMHELLRPTRKELARLYEQEFSSMTTLPVSLAELEQVRESLIAAISSGLTMDEKRFLLSFKATQPEWALLGLPGVEHLPAVRWKLQNLAKLSDVRRGELLLHLQQALGFDGKSD